MPDFTQKLHLGRAEGIVFGESEFSGEDASFEGRVFGTLDQRFPGEDVVFRDGTGGYAVGRRGGEEAVLVEESFGGYGCGHDLGPGGLRRFRREYGAGDGACATEENETRVEECFLWPWSLTSGDVIGMIGEGLGVQIGGS
jgi:hypothetical protein